MTPPDHSRSRILSIVVVLSLLGLILTSIFLSRRSVHDVQQASASIYEDRLVPTGILVNLTSTVYRKRLLLETYVLATNKQNKELIMSSLNRFNRQTDSMMTVFEQTKLTEKEKDGLQLLRQRLSVYNQLEGELMTRLVDVPQAQQALFVGGSSKAFGQVTQMLDELTSLQLTVGEDLVDESTGETNYIYVLTALQIGLVLMIVLSLFWHRL
ncbi:MCP four helix bundle domain-containing protein [Nostoc sp. CHAB 5834]|nr:MCP four helix bundle domain-containing protein [Nostoc sp. CHAB 5834]